MRAVAHRFEIKGKYPSEGESRIEAKLLELIRRYKLESKTIVASFDDERLETFAEAAQGSGIAIGAGNGEARRFVLLTKAGLAGFYRPKADVLQLPVESGGISLKDRRLIDTAHRLNMQVHYWTINDEATMRELLELGADGIITDRPDLLKKVLTEFKRT
ncbi:hypothetical protein FE781_15325 [Paenibacillus thermoaerophilus]|nr:hypothetical protein FE781_15325 [Paenibacillus thermoaerophilus]